MGPAPMLVMVGTTSTPGTTRDVPPPVLAEPGPHPPSRGDQRDGDGLVRLHHRRPRPVVDWSRARVVRLLVGWLAVPRRRPGRAAGASAGDDGADRDGDHGG